MKKRKKQKVNVRSKFKKLRKEKIKEVSKHSLNLITASLIGGVIIFNVYHFLFFSSFFQLKQIKISDNEISSEIKIKEFLKLRKNENIFLVRKERIKENLKGIPSIETVIIRRKIPDTLCLKIIERTPIAYCRINGQLKAIDREGAVFNYKNSEKKVPVILGLIQDKEEEKKKTAIKFLQLLENNGRCSIGKEIVKIGPKDFSKIVFWLRDGTKVFFGRATSPNINLKLTYLEKVLADLKSKEKKIDYVNMQYFSPDMGKVIVKLCKT
ncbi:FtsQ-type POTRA domain-containing protein [bacterium]|nr:FtsQ-type POTRA domain-containing protein [bacterium]